MPEDALSALLPTITLLLGGMIGYLADARRDGRLAKREADADARAVTRESESFARDRSRQREAFERETLLALQEWLLKLVRTRALADLADEEALERTGTWRRELLPPEVNAAHHEAIVQVQRLRERVYDEQTRLSIKALIDCCASDLVPLGDEPRPELERAKRTQRQAFALYGTLQEAIGQRLRAVA